MPYFAKVRSGLVVQVIRAESEFFNTFVDSSPGDWLETSYNTRGNLHYGPDGQPDGGIPFRGNYAGIGYSYSSEYDVFYPPQPYPSWALNHDTWLWEAPIPYPTDGQAYCWDEATVSWIIAPPPVV